MKRQVNSYKQPFVVEPVNCFTRYIPRPSSILPKLLIPITLLGRGRPPEPNCFVGLMLRVGLKPPPVSCLNIGSPPPIPVNCREIVVVPVH